MEFANTFKAGGEMLRWLWGAVAQWSEHLRLPSGYPDFVLFQLVCI